ncbi:fimbria/pilus periplasmic chaperone [Parvularcula sp. IMCC14364]|uniref:fimbria/pilus periplasmic chaperone n=1 Tax=Parvularcula sp. IMCC14364 TaxID=3067902 RepID=UPI00274090FD|nr:fimbria/pilus periplasmic chaperone [Parvularcula sp. IMCC14364]
MRVTLSSSSGESAGVIRVRNTRPTDLPVEILVEKRLIAEDGTQTFVPADDDFIVFPPQALIAPQSTQSIRVQYIGEPSMAETIAYVMKVAEVPVVQEDATGITVAYNFGVALYIRADNPNATLTLSSIEKTDDNKLDFAIRNSGNDYGTTVGKTVVVETAHGRKQIDLTGKGVGNPLIPPNSVRTFSLDIGELDQDINLEGELTASIR